MIKVVNWNIARRREPLRQLAEMDADVALLQEVGAGMAVDLPPGLETGERGHWDTRLWSADSPNRWPMIVKMSDRVDVEWLNQVELSIEPSDDEIGVYVAGSLAAAIVIPIDPADGEPFLVASMYANWKPDVGSWTAVAGIMRDLREILERADVPVLAAGDLNIWYKSGAYKDVESKRAVGSLTDRFGYLYRVYDEGGLYTVIVYYPDGKWLTIWRKGWKTANGALRACEKDAEENAAFRESIASGEFDHLEDFWDMMSSMGLEFMGPQYPNGRQANPRPEYLPSDTKNVVTFQRPGQSLEDADQQLDFVFASRGFHERVKAIALNSVEEWGASDHCRILIEVAPS